MKSFLIFLIFCYLSRKVVHCWDTQELEIFDLVEEINKNFYEFMGVSKNASNAEIKRAFRGLSIQLHPDKNPSEDANIQFRNLVSIYEVLKDTSKREKYDKVLLDGLPNWKSALYYYRRMRKIGLYEGAGIIFLIVTVGQYLFAWAAYFEKRYTAEQVLGSKLKKLQKKNKNIDMETILSEIPSPSLKNTLPIQIPMLIWNLPTTIKETFNRANELKDIALEKRRQEIEEAKRKEEMEKEYEEQIRLRKEKKENLRRRKQNIKAPEKTEEELKGYSQIQVGGESRVDDAIKPVMQKAPLSGSFWTDEDLAELVRLVKKYPAGLENRWVTIAESMNRSVQEITFMAAKMKENGFRVPGQTDSVAENIVQESQQIIKKEKTKKETKIIIPETNWSQEQQKALEAAIVKYRKTAGIDRWEKIANCVPDKSKEQCLIRYKYLCELVKSQKRNEECEEYSEQSTTVAEPLIDAEQSAENAKQEECRSMMAEDLANELSESSGKKRSKRKERRRRRDFSSDEDSDNAYTHEG